MEQKVGDAHMLAAGTNRRNYQMDNLKCLLIFSVVFGHMLELFMGKNSPERVIYLVIYSFHMPLFAFVSGVFARYNPSKIKNNMIYPYLISRHCICFFPIRFWTRMRICSIRPLTGCCGIFLPSSYGIWCCPWCRWRG